MMNVALTNLGQYNEGILNFTWLSLPATEEEIEKAFDEIQVSYNDKHHYGSYGNEYEEFFITDYECDYMDIGEYESLDRLNEIAEEVEGLQEYEQIVVKALMDNGYDLEQAIEQKDDCIVYDDCDSMTDVAYRLMDETGDLDRIPEDLQMFFDYEAYGRYLETGGEWIATDTGYIEVLH